VIDKPMRFFVVVLLERHEGVVVESVERLANHDKTYFGLIRDLVVHNLINSFENLDDSGTSWPNNAAAFFNVSSSTKNNLEKPPPSSMTPNSLLVCILLLEYTVK